MCPVIYIFSFLLSQEKFLFLEKTTQFNVNYSNTRVFTFHLYNCQVTKSNRRNQMEALLQRGFRLNSLNKKV